MTDLEILGIKECDKTLFPTNLPPMSKEEEIEWECAKLNRKFHAPYISKNLNDKLDLGYVWVIVDFEPNNTSNFGCGYTKHLFIIAKTYREIELYCVQRFGEQTDVILQHGTVKLPAYKINKVSQTYFLNKLNSLNNEWEKYNNLEDVIQKGYHYKRYKYHGGPYHVENGVIVSEHEGEIYTMFQPHYKKYVDLTI